MIVRHALPHLFAGSLALVTLAPRASHAGTTPPVAAEKPASKADAIAAGHGSPAASKAATDAAGRKIAARVQKYYGKRSDFSATFHQRYTYAALGRVEEKSGAVQVKRPGLLRWEYAEDKKLMILDGKAFWQWVPEDNQAMVKRDVHGDELSSAFTFLWGKGDLLNEFDARAVPPPEGFPKGDAVELTPKKPGASVQKVIFSVDPQGRVLASQVTDAQGNENRIVFSEAKIDQKLPDSLFQFTPPAGASVQELP